MMIVLDVDECLESGTMCAFRCQNTLGSFHCICPQGYRIADDGQHCVGETCFSYTLSLLYILLKPLK